MSNVRDVTLQASVTKTATFNSTGVITEGQNYGTVIQSLWKRASILLAVTAASGTTPTLDLKIQDSADDVTYNDVGLAFTQATGVTSERKSLDFPLRKYVRAVATIGGTTPSFTYSVKARVEE